MPEGTEGTVSDSGIGTFRVMLMPSITGGQAVSTYFRSLQQHDKPEIHPGAVIALHVEPSSQRHGSGGQRFDGRHGPPSHEHD